MAKDKKLISQLNSGRFALKMIHQDIETESLQNVV